MKRYYAPLLAIFTCLIFIAYSCSGSDDEQYIPPPVAPEIPAPVSPVVIDTVGQPFDKLSDWKFFEGNIQNQIPAEGVIPFAPASPLFTDYALKKRFVWMPAGTKATYNGDAKVLELPVGAVLIKTFYYENVQNIANVGGTRLVETRLMIRKSDGWSFADYVWNADQTEAYFDLVGSFTDISWKDANNVTKSTSYRIPSEVQCIVCHKTQRTVDNSLITKYTPISIKPQNLNYSYNYGNYSRNQLTKWIEYGYLENNFGLPSEQNTTVSYSDTSKPLDTRVRSYFDANCSHCHSTDRHCEYRPMRFAFKDTGGPDGATQMGACVNTEDMQDFPEQLSKIVSPGSPARSMLYYRVNTINETYRMPLHGRTVIHEEGVALIGQWINSLHPCE